MSCDTCKFKDCTYVPPELYENSDFLFIGEAPGADEEELGVPFIGECGQLFREIIEPITSKFKVSITNVVKCRPPNNKTPTKKECVPCTENLIQEILYTNPKLIVTLGKVPTQLVLDKVIKITEYNGKFIESSIPEINKFTILASVHPSYAIRTHNRGILEKGLLPAIHYFDPDTTVEYELVGSIPPIELCAYDSETTGFRPVGKDISRSSIHTHEGKIKCIGVHSNKTLVAEVD